MNYIRSFIAAGALMAMSSQAHAATLGITFDFDDYPADISWSVDDSSGSSVASGGNYNNNDFANVQHQENVELSFGDYTFVIADSYGDGLCCDEGDGEYSLSLDGELFFRSDGTFASGESIDFTVSDVSEVPLPAGMPLVLSGLVVLGLVSRRKRS